jgi:hypothetical protein
MSRKNRKKQTAGVGKSKRGRLLTLGLLAVAIVIAGGAIFFLQSGPNPTPAADMPAVPPLEDFEEQIMVIQLSEPCAMFQKVLSNTPLIFDYGFWGFLPEYEQQNLSNLRVAFYLDGVQIDQQEGAFELVPTVALPCANLSDYSTAFAESGLWAHTTLEHPGLTRGEYVVEIVFYLNERVATGDLDQNGELLYFGPGEVYRIIKELLVE